MTLSTLGGVTTFTKQKFLAVNGYSNEYWGWSAEDDDLSNRVRTYYRLVKVPRPANEDDYHIYQIQHQRDASNQRNMKRGKLEARGLKGGGGPERENLCKEQK